MAGVRLFLGGLSSELQEEELKGHLNRFGNLVNLDIKDKKDIVSGEVIKRFAFATLDASPASIEQCIAALDGKTLCGSSITVQRAQESFIERLKREREARAQGKSATDGNEPAPTLGYPSISYDNSYDNSSWGNNDSRNDWSYEGQNTSRGYSEETNQNNYSQNKQSTERLLPDLQPYSDVWDDADCDAEGRQEQQQAAPAKAAEGSHIKRRTKMARYDPTKVAAQAVQAVQAVQDPTPPPAAAAASAAAAAAAAAEPMQVTPTVVMSKDLAFTGASSSFSLLDMLHSSTQESVTCSAPSSAAVQQVEEPVQHAPASDVTERSVQPKVFVKRSKFFIDSSDPQVQENLFWAYQEINPTQIEKFQKDREEIMSLYNDRLRKAASDRKDDMPTQAESWRSHPIDEFQSWDNNSVSLVSDSVSVAQFCADSFRPAGTYATESHRGKQVSRGRYVRRGGPAKRRRFADKAERAKCPV